VIKVSTNLRHFQQKIFKHFHLRGQQFVS